jgi:predicted AAA+ superfamily ATPase
MHYWQIASGAEVDFVMYGERGLLAFEVKRSSRVRSEDLRPLAAFLDDYPMARGYAVYGGTRDYFEGGIRVLPIEVFLRDLGTILANRVR